MGRGVTVEETGHPEGGGGFGEGGDIADSRVAPDLASGGGGGYSMDVEVVGQTGEVGVRFVLEKSWNIGRGVMAWIREINVRMLCWMNGCPR